MLIALFGAVQLGNSLPLLSGDLMNLAHEVNPLTTGHVSRIRAGACVRDS